MAAKGLTEGWIGMMTGSPYVVAHRTIADVFHMDDTHPADVRRNAAKQIRGWQRLLKKSGDSESYRFLKSWYDVAAAAVAEQCVRMMGVV